MINGGSLAETGEDKDDATFNSKVADEQQVILNNLAMSSEIANVNLAQQNAVNKQSALFQLEMATIGKCVEIIMRIDPNSPHAKDNLETYQSLMQNLVQIFKQMEPSITRNNVSSEGGSPEKDSPGRSADH
ncbi:hypothetical protein PN466_11425 [Roseofilum reptotaenium CS-1145]|uniref:Uncharacterized protein n=1 Tax=Roseofilum reptotaenium AO1-A TaxID=1925591 RepID=A0A1L9QNI3_9CYAN|nr:MULTISPECIES: hypothetical protein [Roseofilum]MBP0030009.1 hypothetical protein [Roseofilum sp. Guam]MDB9517558.1 hypothetical protein [Roseofilum reptotaenium CS-1145]OJJ24248.1 hypothetical protein BI308_17375 [Roseofilum reptotaenium AO1-A]